ncbi:MAG: hypothetical protein A2268_02240 [Candidatus Raymondbacteria bacterium RifOxyA12_full_50_37]|uniref:Prepilin-type N-terminal cleavage/methylation domain-containing protein n=1 Tax=Candidatus Raymondbacteria bacterium RIFOXYD12_FULL_49_13 TaxID=1817890 RepID=A0A1F7F5F4_UNCRA|nr:MAG: hypothetical protein A2350_07765 [Candidatus Raymondbacteria bacterium RifOxyB12_full_50_8]OGJ91274.1 MAG: hypothetical protein A2268_02240 [Candidatus Raymondbacteria bacterium RifOxyA12_full_50_37]OGJ92244.1 MAG: hypothetical protein A2248_11070 [Candidatus Raymondbacteria bacterium RIFOXYA2_FULL_49_16]OGJ98570.1 MAG: hypothetical protein A2453_06870 [Candidatus Raymondbacteria bacterium RIFOXYC2_FULL_50_21]OGK01871.1 MAG: hypothetical protein A2519_04765 [Candidatus Raymondbacteria b
MLNNQKGHTLSELIVVVLLMSLVSIFAFQAYLYIHKRFIGWQQDHDAALIIIRLAQGLDSYAGKAGRIMVAQPREFSFINTEGQSISIKAQDHALLANGRNLLSNETLLREVIFEYFAHGKPCIAGEGGPIDCVGYTVVFLQGKKVYSCKGSVALRRLHTFNTAGIL